MSKRMMTRLVYVAVGVGLMLLSQQPFAGTAALAIFGVGSGVVGWALPTALPKE